MELLISVIMSTYNESIKELDDSISSVLNQTYSNIEFIIINDNPNNHVLDEYLSNVTDDRVKIVKNEKNIGLVKSLNKALQLARGEYIARMDADDIAMPNRLEIQKSFLEQNSLDMVGCDIQLINEKGDIIKERMHFPSEHKNIQKYIQWGNCIAHPTWFVKKDVYVELKGYRNVKSCEDYDFILRVLDSSKYKLGNVPYIGLKYRIREKGISMSTDCIQYLLRRFLSKNRNRINDLSEKAIEEHQNTSDFNRNVKLYKKYKDTKTEYKKCRNVYKLSGLLFNKYLYILAIEKYHLKEREKM